MSTAVAFRPNAHAQRELAALLSEGAPRSMADAARELGVTVSAVAHVLTRMQSAGVEIQFLDAGAAEGESRVRLLYPHRVCAVAGCGTILRRTNPSDRCELHRAQVAESPAHPLVSRARDGRVIVEYRELRQLAGLTLRAAAGMADVSASYLHRVETGERVPSALVAARITAALCEADVVRRVPASSRRRRCRA